MASTPKDFVKAALAAKGISQLEIARLSGEDPTTVSHVIAGKRSNRAPVVLRVICDTTGLIYGDVLRMYGLDRRVAA